MNCLNSVLVEGTVEQGPYRNETPDGTVVCTFVVASRRKYRVGDEVVAEVSYFDVEVTGSLAERCAEELTKGRGVRLVGRLAQDRWETAGGRKRSRVKVVAEHVELKSFAM